MLTLLVGLGTFLLGVGVTGGVARYFFLMGWEMALDDRRLEPGAVGSLPSQAPAETAVEVTGPIRAVGSSSGRHAKIEWPTDCPDTEVLEPVRDEVTA